MVGRTKTNALADAIVPERRGVGSGEVKDHRIGAPRSVQPVGGVLSVAWFAFDALTDRCLD